MPGYIVNLVEHFPSGAWRLCVGRASDFPRLSYLLHTDLAVVILLEHVGPTHLDDVSSFNCYYSDGDHAFT